MAVFPYPLRRARLAAACLEAMLGAMLATPAAAEQWVEVGADTQAKYYVDVDSIAVDGDTLRVLKRGVFTQVLTDDLGGAQASFKQTLGTVEIDCGRRLNRVTRIEMIGEDGRTVWSSGDMKKRLWEDVRADTHAETTLQVVCAHARHPPG